MTAEEQMIEQLDLVVSTLKLAFAEQLAVTRSRVRADETAAAILDLTSEDWVASGELQKRVAKDVGADTRSVRRRFPDLIALGALHQRGSGKATAYRSTGLI